MKERKCAQCRGDGEVASGRVDEDVDELPPILCPRCGGTGRDPLQLVPAPTGSRDPGEEVGMDREELLNRCHGFVESVHNLMQEVEKEEISHTDAVNILLTMQETATELWMALQLEHVRASAPPGRRTPNESKAFHEGADFALRQAIDLAHNSQRLDGQTTGGLRHALYSLIRDKQPEDEKRRDRG